VRERTRRRALEPLSHEAVEILGTALAGSKIVWG
jgi:hypothetical protein